MRPKLRKKLLVALAALAGVIALGPRSRFEEEWAEPSVGADVDAWLEGREALVPRLRAGEAKSVLWADPATRARTQLAVVYLHGFSADKHEVEPLVSDLARELGANAYFTRLAGHGQDGDAMAETTVEDWLMDAAEAMAVGSALGERVVLVGTSTGATLALWAATRPETADRLAMLVLVSPNLGLRDRSSRLLLWPWGGAIARVLVGPERCFEPMNEAQALHWTTCYPTSALLPMMALVERVRSLDLGDVRTPTLVIYSLRDQVVDPSETGRVLAGLGQNGPVWQVVADSGDPAHHVIAGAIMSPSTTNVVRESIAAFVEAMAR